MVYACGGNLDLKFGISVNDQLDDQILVSIIAGNFNTEFDFSVNPGTKIDLSELKAQREKNLQDYYSKKAEQDKKLREQEDSEENKDEANLEESIIPEFLNDDSDM